MGGGGAPGYGPRPWGHQVGGHWLGASKLGEKVLRGSTVQNPNSYSDYGMD